MITIHLNNVLFHSFHGLHEEETIVGGNYEINASVSYMPNSGTLTSLNESVNYVTLYEIVKKRMEQPTPLLETVIMDITEQFLAQFSIIREVNISLTKLQPPIRNFRGSVMVSYQRKRE